MNSWVPELQAVVSAEASAVRAEEKASGEVRLPEGGSGHKRTMMTGATKAGEGTTMTTEAIVNPEVQDALAAHGMLRTDLTPDCPRRRVYVCTYVQAKNSALV
jgi:hypothetical protein